MFHPSKFSVCFSCKQGHSPTRAQHYDQNQESDIDSIIYLIHISNPHTPLKFCQSFKVPVSGWEPHISLNCHISLSLQPGTVSQSFFDSHDFDCFDGHRSVIGEDVPLLGFGFFSCVDSVYAPFCGDTTEVKPSSTQWHPSMWHVILSCPVTEGFHPDHLISMRSGTLLHCIIPFPLFS